MACIALACGGGGTKNTIPPKFWGYNYSNSSMIEDISFACYRSVVCNEPNILFCTLYVVFINESENKS